VNLRVTGNRGKAHGENMEHSENRADILPPQIIALTATSKDYEPLLEPPTTVRLRSGCITLKPGESVGEHSTQGHEEVLIVLSGRAELRFDAFAPVGLSAHRVAYLPPGCMHDVANIGIGPLTYIYLISPAQ
jgi:mannose-6-phosphate isomerase-like protein (cupin superfamily)